MARIKLNALLGTIAALAMAAALTFPAAQAEAAPADFFGQLAAKNASYSGTLASVSLEFYDISGAIAASCVPEKGVNTSNGDVSFECDLSGNAGGIDLVVLVSDEITEVFYVAAADGGSMILRNIDGDKVGYLSSDVTSGDPLI